MIINKISELRKEKNITQSQLANELGVSRQTIISLDLAMKISKFFNCIYHSYTSLQIHYTTYFITSPIASPITESTIFDIFYHFHLHYISLFFKIQCLICLTLHIFYVIILLERGNSK